MPNWAAHPSWWVKTKFTQFYREGLPLLFTWKLFIYCRKKRLCPWSLWATGMLRIEDSNKITIHCRSPTPSCHNQDSTGGKEGHANSELARFGERRAWDELHDSNEFSDNLIQISKVDYSSHCPSRGCSLQPHKTYSSDCSPVPPSPCLTKFLPSFLPSLAQVPLPS